MNSYSIDVTSAGFETDVVAASADRLVLVDFWAPWCGPCRALKPVLEKLAVQYAGKFRLAKLNTDEHPDIAQRYAIRGIPNVKAFVGGIVVAELNGAQPESRVREFIDRLLPGPADSARRAAQAALAAGDFELAEAKLGEALEIDPQSAEARIELAELHAARQDLAGAAEIMKGLGEASIGRDLEPRRDALAARITAWENSQALPDAYELAVRMDREPDNLDLRLGLAERLIAELQLEAALSELLSIVKRSRGTANATRESARKAMLRVFTIGADQVDMVARYRRLLAAELN